MNTFSWGQTEARPPSSIPPQVSKRDNSDHCCSIYPSPWCCVFLPAQTGSQESLEHAKVILECVLNALAPKVSSDWIGNAKFIVQFAPCLYQLVSCCWNPALSEKSRLKGPSNTEVTSLGKEDASLVFCLVPPHWASMALYDVGFINNMFILCVRHGI